MLVIMCPFIQGWLWAWSFVRAYTYIHICISPKHGFMLTDMYMFTHVLVPTMVTCWYICSCSMHISSEYGHILVPCQHIRVHSQMCSSEQSYISIQINLLSPMQFWGEWNAGTYSHMNTHANSKCFPMSACMCVKVISMGTCCESIHIHMCAAPSKVTCWWIGMCSHTCKFWLWSHVGAYAHIHANYECKHMSVCFTLLCL